MPASLASRGVLLVDLAAGSGGAETRVIDTATGLVERGVPVVVVCIAGRPLAAALRAAGVATATVAGSKWDPRVVPALRAVLDDRGDWAVDAHNAQSQLAVQLAVAGRRHGGRLVATVHSEYRDSERRLLGLSAHELVLRRSIRAGWGLVAVTDGVRRNLESLGAPAGGIDVIWSGIRESRGEATTPAISVRKGVGLLTEHFVVVAAGRLVPVKNYRLAIHAIHRLHESLPEARLLVVGSGPERPQLERLVRQLAGPPGLVRFTGRRDDVPDVLGAADAMVITSLTEGLPYVLLEAVAAGTPVVSTAVGAIPDLFGDGAVALLPRGAERTANAAQLLADELLALARSPRRRRQLAVRAADVQRRHLSLEALLTSSMRTYRLCPDQTQVRARDARHAPHQDPHQAVHLDPPHDADSHLAASSDLAPTSLESRTS